MNKRFIWISELILWIVIATIISFLFVFLHFKHEQKTNSYYMFFNDIDGLTKGSPVRLMGMQIGYVQDISVFDDRVFVSFLVTDGDTKLPEPSIATVEFYGLGGSKSLEIMPYNSELKTGEEYIITKEPYRIQTFYNVQNNIAKTLVNMYNSITVIIGKDEKGINNSKKYLKINSKVNKINEHVHKTKAFEEKYLNCKRFKWEVPDAESENHN